jgi:hypothetical protein
LAGVQAMQGAPCRADCRKASPASAQARCMPLPVEERHGHEVHRRQPTQPRRLRTALRHAVALRGAVRLHRHLGIVRKSEKPNCPCLLIAV